MTFEGRQHELTEQWTGHEGRLPDLAVAVGCWVAASAMLIGLGHAASADPGGDIVTPHPVQPAW